MFERMLRKTCVIIRRSEDENNLNAYGDPEIDEDISDPIPCEVQQRRAAGLPSSVEPVSEGEIATTRFSIWLPDDVGPLDTTDAIIFEGQVYELAGDPELATAINERWGFVEATIIKTGKVPEES